MRWRSVNSMDACRDLKDQIPVWACKGSDRILTRTLDISTRAGFPECCQHNARASAGDNTGQNADKEHIPSHKIEIKIPNLGGKWIRSAGLEDRDSTDQATGMDIKIFVRILYIFNSKLNFFPNGRKNTITYNPTGLLLISNSIIQ